VSYERARWRFTASHRLTPRLQLGVEWNPAGKEANPIGNYILTPETNEWPMVSLGTSSDRIGTPPGPMAYYMTFAKAIPSLKAGPYFSINYSEYEKAFNFPFGINFSLTPELDLLYMNDARKSHILLTIKQPKFNLSFMWIHLKHPGISISWGF